MFSHSLIHVTLISTACTWNTSGQCFRSGTCTSSTFVTAVSINGSCLAL